MVFSEASIKIFPKIYSVVNRSGLLKQDWTKPLFRSAYFAYKRYLEDPFNGLIKHCPELFRAGHVIDIGANIGYTAKLFTDIIDPGFRVYAFEPDVDNFYQLELIANKVGKDKLLAYQAAIAEEPGTVELWHNSAHHADHRVVTSHLRNSLNADEHIYTVPKVSIDQFLSDNQVSDPIAFIKVDVQGYELPVCNGLKNTLDNNPNAVVAIEYFPAALEELGFEAEKLIQFFYERDYKLYYFSRTQKPKMIKEDEISRHLGSKGYFDFIASKRDFTKAP